MTPDISRFFIHRGSVLRGFSTAAWPLLATALFLTLATGQTQAQRVLLDWSEQVADEPPARLSGNASMTLRNEPKAKIVNTESDPANPFPASPLALLVVKSSDTASVDVDLTPFLQQTVPKKGWVEMELAMTEGGSMVIGLGAGASDAAPMPQYDGTILYQLFLRADDTALVVPAKSGGMEPFVISPPLASLKPQTIRITWDFEGEKPTVGLLVDGEPFLTGNEPAALGIDAAKDYQGIDRVLISIHSGFLGKVTVSE